MFSRRDEYAEAELPAQLIIDTVLCSNPILKVPLPLFQFFFLFFFLNRASYVKNMFLAILWRAAFTFPAFSYFYSSPPPPPATTVCVDMLERFSSTHVV